MTPNELANAIRALAMDAVEKAASGHPGMPMGMADVATVLFTRFLKYDAADPAWPDRDRFVLSAGHGSMLLYALLHLAGYESVSIEDIRNFRQIGGRTPGHPEFGHTAGVETTTGPLGQGLATAVGMALAERMLAARFGPALVDHRTWVMASDGDLMEGVSHEAGALAGHLGLDRLIVLWDDNGISIDGPTALSMSDDHRARFRSYGWHVQEVDGHDQAAIAEAMAAAVAAPQPSLIACRTTIGYGAPTKAGTASSHGSPLGAAEIEGARAALGWTHGPFEVPAEILSAWRQAGSRGAEARSAWQSRLAGAGAELRDEFERRLAGRLPDAVTDVVADLKRTLATERPKMATRQSSQRVIEVLAPHIPELAGGSADLTGSNLTLGKGMAAVTPDDGYAGRYVYFGVREHGMAAALNGMALHGGFVPYGGTFFVFTDYCRPAIRLAALMGVRVVYVMTHDSIGLGEDGPTHQPVEHLASLRAMPNILVLRPADTVETAECWAAALRTQDRPSVLVLSRQGLPAVRLEHVDENLCARGAYVLSPADGRARVTLIGTGSEVSTALEARDLLQAEGIPTAVVSMPCWSLFDAQNEDYRQSVLPADTVKVAVEAAATFGWERYVGTEGAVVGIDSFGASGPAGKLYEHFGITAKAVAAAAKARLRA